MRRPNSVWLNCEPLEARDVPAIVLDARFTPFSLTTSDTAPTGGTVSVQEIQFDATMPLFNRDGTAAPRTTKSGTASDSIQFFLSGTTLTITCSDGIFGRASNNNNRIVTYGTTLTVNNVTGLNVGLQFGGNDTVTDNTTLNSTINAGPGNDIVNGLGGDSNPLLFQLLQFRGVLTPPLFAQLTTGVVTKTLIGGDGDDIVGVLGSANGWTIDGGFGNDVINGPASGALNILGGGGGNDMVFGPQFGFFNFLDGGAGSDTVAGGFGPDIITGGFGNDIVSGLGGGDYYLERDVDGDVILNRAGDLVFADSFDIRATR